jgi:hypothetical protein
MEISIGAVAKFLLEFSASFLRRLKLKDGNIEMNTNDRWKLTNNKGIVWDVKNDARLPHCDHLEMSGRFVSLYVEYGINACGELELSQTVVWPMLRTIPNNTHASLQKKYGKELTPSILINGSLLAEEKPFEIHFDGILTIQSTTSQQIEVTRTICPSRANAAAIEHIKLRNRSGETVEVSIEAPMHTAVERGAYGIYMLEVVTEHPSVVALKPGEEFHIGITFNGRKLMEQLVPLATWEVVAERKAFVDGIAAALQLVTPDDVLNQSFHFAKVRVTESIFQTANGLMHSPGGLAFYAAVWANDEAEYAGPFFPYLGDPGGIEASLNCYRLFMPFMGPDYRAIPSSIIAEGFDIWEGVGDRGDAAMYAYGASRFALSTGDRSIGEELWPAIEWCLEYCRRQTIAEGVIASDSDELEERFPSGQANLSTSSIAYGGLRAAAHLGRALGQIDSAAKYEEQAKRLSQAIDAYFGANVEGYDTYRYYEGNEVLRSWICLPLTMGIMERKEGTIAALFSSQLWTTDGLATQNGDITYWDRSTLYGFRGAFAAGEQEQAFPYLTHFSRRRTLGEHVPYAVEAYPEGNQRHLSAESALYCLIFIEGLFGIAPTGFNSFSCTPNLPKEWPAMSLKAIQAFGKEFDMSIERQAGELKVSINVKDGILQAYTCKAGQQIHITI